MLESIIAFAIVWSIGCVIENESRKRFDAFLRNLLQSMDSMVLYPVEFTVCIVLRYLNNSDMIRFMIIN